MELRNFAGRNCSIRTLNKHIFSFKIGYNFYTEYSQDSNFEFCVTDRSSITHPRAPILTVRMRCNVVASLCVRHCVRCTANSDDLNRAWRKPDGITFPVKTKHLYNICTKLDQRWRRWADVLKMWCRCYLGVESVFKHQYLLKLNTYE